MLSPHHGTGPPRFLQGPACDTGNHHRHRTPANAGTIFATKPPLTAWLQGAHDGIRARAGAVDEVSRRSANVSGGAWPLEQKLMPAMAEHGQIRPRRSYRSGHLHRRRAFVPKAWAGALGARSHSWLRLRPCSSAALPAQAHHGGLPGSAGRHGFPGWQRPDQRRPLLVLRWPATATGRWHSARSTGQRAGGVPRKIETAPSSAQPNFAWLARISTEPRHAD